MSQFFKYKIPCLLQVKDHQFSKKVKVENKTGDVLKTKATKLSKKKKLKAK